VRLPEQLLWDRMRRNLWPAVWLNRIENLCGVGDPDVEALCNGHYSKIELKAQLTAPARVDTPLLGGEGLSIEQRNFMLGWLRHGGRGFVLVGLGKGREAQQFLLEGSCAESINAMPVVKLAEFALATDWDNIARFLGSPR
jgi:hypothetical protein